MTKILCDQCGSECQPHIVELLLVESAHDFCSSECFWKWVEEKKPKMDHHEFVRLAKSTMKHDWVSCANCDGMGCLVCEGKGGFGVEITPKSSTESITDKLEIDRGPYG